MNQTNASTTTPGSGPAGNRGRGASSDPYRLMTIGWGVLCVVTIPAMLLLVRVSLPSPSPDPVLVAAEHYGLEPATYATGRRTYQAVCATCHGSWGEGVAKLGKPLRNSAFVQGASDGELAALITNGRAADDPANSSGMLMPARGSSELVTDETIPALVAYLRTMQDETAPARDVSAWVVSPEDRQAALAAAEVSAAESGLDLNHPGRALFVNSCSSCHGPNGEGMEGLGKPFTTSDFIGAKTDKELMNFVKTGRPMWDADNTTGVDMPPKGGNPALGDDDLRLIVEYVRAIHDSAGE